MLIFVDGEQSIKVFRLTTVDDKTSRKLIGSVKKKDESFSGEIASLTGDEARELQEVLSFYREAGQAEDRADLLRFPSVVRRVVKLALESESEVEKRMVFAAITEGLRSFRRSERDEVGTIA